MKTRLTNILLTTVVGFFAGAPLQGQAQGLDVAQQPLFLRSREAPLNMLVVGRDHKLFYEAYNDASDLNADGRLDIGYRGHLPDNQGGVTYFGYFDSFRCYAYNSGVFEPVSVTTNKRCSGNWSGDFLNYLTTVRIDALRKVLYGGTRSTDIDGRTILERARIVQDAHTSGKEYTSVAVDGYNIAEFAPLSAPRPNSRHLFASTTLAGDETRPLLRVLNDSGYRIWNWVSIEGPVAGTKCMHGRSGPDCANSGGTGVWQTVPQEWFVGDTRMTTWWHDGNAERPGVSGRITGYPMTTAAMDLMFASGIGARGWPYTVNSGTGVQHPFRCGTNAIRRIVHVDPESNNNPFAGAVTQGGQTCSHERYLAEFEGLIQVPTAGQWEFAIDADDSALLTINGVDYSERPGLQARCNCPHDPRVVSMPATAVPFRFRFIENTGGDSWSLKARPVIGPSAITDYTVRVEVCKPLPVLPSGVSIESNCKIYPNGNAKPTGLLHDYGESNTMMFGLLSGSNDNNTQGGVLRKAVSSFRDEVDPNTGRFTTTRGIVYTLDRFRIINFNMTAGQNGSYGDCGWITTRAINNGECRAWGNPIAEMLFEAMRYWAGAPAATPGYNDARTDSADAVLGLPIATWNTSTNPYAPGNFPYCAKPFNTVISDINPSYDSNLPGMPFVSAGNPPVAEAGYVGDVPASLSALNVSTLGQTIWNWEFSSPNQNIFIGQVGSLNDSAPTAKMASSFGNIRGLSPEEPTKQGTYYSAMVAYFGRVNDVSTATDPQQVQTFGVALASPLPRIVFPVGRGIVTMVPFAKSIGGDLNTPTDAQSNFQPTNTIVDFYIEELANTDALNMDPLVNENRPFGVFRINYEDVEQGADHDMDMIVKYTLRVTDQNTLEVRLDSEFAAGGIIQSAGYVISGTTSDGIYLEVLDRDTNNPTAYRLNTPPTRLPGFCSRPRSAAVETECGRLPGYNNSPLGTFATRTFTAGATEGARLLRDPLWYMAKYGGFKETPTPENPNNNRPDLLPEWDADSNGDPDNYFLVTNALNLRRQLALAFEEVLRRAAPAGSVATNSTRVDVGGLAYQAEFDARDWSGDVKGITIDSRGRPVGVNPNWSANSKLTCASGAGPTCVPLPFASRKIFTTTSRTAPVAFAHSNLSTAQQALVTAPIVDWVRGQRSNEQPSGTLRRRDSLIADVLNSNPAVLSAQDFGYCNLPEAEGGCSSTSASGGTTGPYATYLASIARRKPYVFVGANGGMLHAFDGSLGSFGGGTEKFGFVPRAVIANLPQLASPNYVHRYYADGSPTISDAYIGSRWRSVLVGTTGAGGRSVFALDVTDPENFAASSVLWERTEEDDPDLGLTIGKASIVKLQTGQWAAVFGNGYNSQNHEAMLFVVDLATGALIRKYDTNVGTASAPNGLGSPVVADTEGLFGNNLAADSKGNFAYAGDLQGNLWRFDLSSAAAPVRLFTALDAANRPQPIVAAPSVQAYGGPVASGNRGLMVYFGTGRFFVTGDNVVRADDPRNAFYGIRDLGDNTTVNLSQLVRQTVTDTAVLRTTSENRVDYASRRGFYIDLSGGFPGERVLNTPVFRFGQVFFSTYSPLGGSCNPTSRGFIMSVSPFSGIGTLQALGVNVGNGGAGLFVQSSSPVPPTLLVTDRYLLALTQIDPANPLGTPPPECLTDPNLPQCVVSGASTIAIPRVSGRLSWKQLR